MHRGNRIRTHWFLASTMTCVVAIVSGFSSAAADEYRSAGNGDWSDLEAWEIEGPPGTWSTPTSDQDVPGSDDCVTVRPTHFIAVDQDVTIRCLLIRAQGTVDFGLSNRTLSITDAGGLTIELEDAAPFDPGVLAVSNDGAVLALTGGGSHTIYGVIELQNSMSTLRIQNADSELNGTGKLLLLDAYAAVRIDGSRQLTIGPDFTMAGQGEIKRLSGTADAKFRNKGTVVANISNSELLLDINVAFDDAEGARWEATLGSSLLFGRGSTDCGIEGDFVLNGGSLSFAFEVRTTGTFTCVSGSVVGTLRYDCDCSANPPCSQTASGCP